MRYVSRKVNVYDSIRNFSDEFKQFLCEVTHKKM